MSNLLSQASLVMIPSGYKEDVVYSQIPTSGAGDLSFTRASNGTRVNSAGLVEVVPWNLAQQSNAFSASPWSRNLTTLTSGQTDPNGGSNAWKVEFSAGSAYLYQPTILVTGVVTMSAYLRSDSTTTIGFNDGSAYPNSITIGTTWQRYEFSFNVTGTNTAIQFDNYFGVSPSGQAKTFYIYGAQLNIGSTAKPYFPTTDRLNVPRLTYQNGGGGCPSLLLEKQSTNVFSYSQELDNGFWTPLQITITANNTTSPDGTQNADKITEDAVNGVHLFYNTSAVTGSATSTASIFYKKGTRRYFSVKLQIGSNSYTQVFDADGVTTGSNSSNGLTSVSTSIVSMGNGWVRASVTGTDPSASTACYMICSLSNSATPTFDSGNFNPSYLGSTSEYGYFWGAQLEASSYPTSYIPTTSSSATRVADVCYKTGISSLIGQTEGVLFADFVANSAETTIIAINDPANPSTNIIYIQAQIGDVWRAYVVNGGVYQVAITAGSGATGRCKMAFAYKQNDFVLYANGQLILADSSGTVPACSAFYLGYYNGAYLPLQTNEAILFPTRLTNSELASLTTI